MRWAWILVVFLVACSGGITSETSERASLADPAGAAGDEAGAGASGASSGGSSAPAAGQGGQAQTVGGALAAGAAGEGVGADAATGGGATGGAGAGTGGAPAGAGATAGGAGGAGAVPATGGAGAGAGGVLPGGGAGGVGPVDCYLIARLPYTDLELGSCCCCGPTCDAYHGFCEDGVTDTIAISAPAMRDGAIVVEAWSSEAVDETQPDTWPRLWIEWHEADAVRVAGLPVSRFWFEVGERAAGVITLRADHINGPNDQERDLNIDAIELWECSP